MALFSRPDKRTMQARRDNKPPRIGTHNVPDAGSAMPARATSNGGLKQFRYRQAALVGRHLVDAFEAIAKAGGTSSVTIVRIDTGRNRGNKGTHAPVPMMVHGEVAAADRRTAKGLFETAFNAICEARAPSGTCSSPGANQR